MTRELSTESPVCDAVCFHARQCAEKYLKAFLSEHDIEFPRTHDLDGLAVLFGTLVPQLDALQPPLDWLSIYAMEVRYPGASANRNDAEIAARIASEVRAVIREALGLPTG